MILADTSVWIDHLRSPVPRLPERTALSRLFNDDGAM